jgi:hypothetical protein
MPLSPSMVLFRFAMFFRLCVGISFRWLLFDLHQYILCCCGLPTGVLLQLFMLDFRMGCWASQVMQPFLCLLAVPSQYALSHLNWWPSILVFVPIIYRATSFI